MTFTITKAERTGTPALISIWGPSGSGKTYSAIKLARGLVGPDGKFGVIDSENKRSKFYASLCAPWHHLDLQPPFTPARYTEAVKAYEAAGGFGCIIIDVASHEWEGEGGVIEMADAQRNRDGKPLTGIGKWRMPKLEHKKMLNHLLRAPCSVIFCLRAKELYEQKGGDVNLLGMVPIAEKSFVYEMTLHIELGMDHIPTQKMKCPEELLEHFPRGQMITEKTGTKIAEWIGAGATFDTAQAQLEREARTEAARGWSKMQDWWQARSGADKQALKGIQEELRGIAKQADLRPDPPSDSGDGDESQEDGADDNPFDEPQPAQAPTESDPLDDRSRAEGGDKAGDESGEGEGDEVQEPDANMGRRREDIEHIIADETDEVELFNGWQASRDDRGRMPVDWQMRLESLFINKRAELAQGTGQ